MSFELTWGNNNCILSFQGKADLEKAINSTNIFVGDSRFESIEYIILNLLELEEFELDQQEIKIISTIDKGSSRWNNKLNLACVTNDSKIREIILEYKKEMSDIEWKIELFENMEEARVWCEMESK